METQSKNLSKTIQVCFFKAGLILSAVFSLGFYLKGTPGYFIFLFLGGWLAWTFVEYGVHRFLMHELIIPGQKDNLFHHHEHHSHPQNLRVNFLHRLTTLFLGVVILWTAILRNDSFSIFAGFFTGFLLYNYLHYLLHQPICRYIFPKIQRAHILHHSRFPNQGYSFSTILWDWLFGTFAPKNFEITDKMRENYFKSSRSGKSE